MSLQTLHADAQRLCLLMRQVPARLSARLCGVEPALALGMQEWLTAPPARASELPTAFTTGAAAACFALVKISVVKPAVFWGALVAFASLPVLAVLRRI
ncbi:hypothetical protein [Cupriavidus numazuensis]|uniref:Uncharacterized protein n=1 Tax=Cupriavidus numazuensis TaxID=221992 RepID=A0ABM8TMV6_9BURK|nr:hypothetical protein [Cupriavidus numazuensis]CAG2155395.1 hypothetical protein LMG26411_04925 [Cupriavidus numazuensis]